ncbi:catalase family protein [Massilia aurea]|uniref:catalase family protein n=1 Tax=Massilia aurea TaxID=373040 RepID=UPI00346378FD
MTIASTHPVPFRAEFEHIGLDESETIHALQTLFANMAKKVADAEGHASRAVHAKGHALVRGKLTVLDNLPPQLAQGLFGQAGTYDVLLRWSSPPAEQLPDGVSTPRAVAMKVLDVPGARLDTAKSGNSQDFLMVNGPVFSAPDPQGFLRSVKLLAATTNATETGKKIISAVLRTAEGALEAVGGQSGTLKSMGGEPQHHPLGETYFSQTPYLYGQYMAKFSLAPIAPELLSLDGESIKTEDDAQRHAIGSHFQSQGGEWELRVQLNVDVEKMPIEDASVEWPEELSSYVAVARVRLEPQTSWDASLQQLEDEIAYDQWNCLATHRPLGSVNRARRRVMATSREFRSEFNRCPIHEPSA